MGQNMMVKYNMRSWWLTSASILFLQNFISCVFPSVSCAPQQRALNPAGFVFVSAQSLIQWPLVPPLCLPSTLHVQEIKQFRSQADREQRLKAKKTFHSSQFSHQCSHVSPKLLSALSVSLGSSSVLHSSSLLPSSVFSSVPSL